MRFSWAALATGVLVVLGLLGLGILGSGGIGSPFDARATGSATPIISASSTPTVEPSLDAAVVITVLNGTPTTGLAGAVGDLLEARGWQGAAVGVGTRASADELNIQDTVVYYADPSRESAAKALVEDLGVGTVLLSDQYPDSAITIVLGLDYSLPAA